MKERVLERHENKVCIQRALSRQIPAVEAPFESCLNKKKDTCEVNSKMSRSVNEKRIFHLENRP
jgi:hypothetical protein